ncbi:uncharacterized protein PADG_00022 [Paracoccidioides brasiliensis Pb18]|uniref:F-box domain-containing protein n=2 Tax=Paracoccidioides brasiliensis TaxID=121759 RepID=C1FZI2_PARBD|nr:uncharacterized protein PADG_00022 [Paracoccidioides brasiliensis Pb18]EEH43733.2 hypothetical protein PADG_00022 [Paracoccidioides brasiliensis Pb18]ODH25649.1 hypothetical protein ACO22_05192 [Paracoccidioides brasiliensis]
MGTTTTLNQSNNNRRPLSFLHLPPEIRHEIYTLALSWPNLRVPFARLRYECEMAEAIWFTYRPRIWPAYLPRTRCSYSYPKSALPPPHIPKSDYITPTVFLLCRQITYEALPVLHAQELVIDEPPPYSMALGRPVDISMFISKGALQQARRVVLKIDIASLASRWARTVDTLLDIWYAGNRLEELRVVALGDFTRRRSIIVGEEGMRLIVLKMFEKLRIFGDDYPSGIKVLFEGYSPSPPVN